MNKPLLINFTPTGMIPTKKMTPHVPISVEEITEQVHQAYELGITIAHLHARDKDGKPTTDADTYGRIVENVRRVAPNLVICVSLSGRNATDIDQRAAPLELTGSAKPDMGSLTLSSLNFIQQASKNSPDTIQQLAIRMNDRGIVPELEAFDTGMINYGLYLIRKGILTPPFYFNLIFGNIANAQADLLHTGLAVQQLPEDCHWSFGGIGNTQLSMNTLAVASGGSVRVGLEDNIYMDAERSRLASNIELLQRIHDLARIHERPIMDGAELKAEWKLAA
jgi:uncharacterized protein (DUF849 family)